mmetsp:Transcript_27985/g.64597  ORF Transcript_27985/g.64597 Transcript_27985/m.64597 type:complete len:110 (-) Transcript_27985:1761-2090(-)
MGIFHHGGPQQGPDHKAHPRTLHVLLRFPVFGFHRPCDPVGERRRQPASGVYRLTVTRLQSVYHILGQLLRMVLDIQRPPEGVAIHSVQEGCHDAAVRSMLDKHMRNLH